ncbi:MAG: GNAT family N-acetyltransferase [Spirochaetota bacterium]
MTYHHVRSNEEARAVSRLAVRVFGAFSVLLVPRKPKWAIYATNDEGEMVGGIVLKKLGHEAGIVDWVFVDKAARGQGLGPELVDRGLAELEEAGCRHQFALVRDDNTPSWNMFATRGFDIPNIIRLYFGFGAAVGGYSLLLTFALLGYSMWHRDSSQPSGPRVPARGVGLATILLLALAVSGLFALQSDILGALFYMLPMVGGITIVRLLLSWPFARAYGPVRVQVPHSGVPLSLGLGLLGAWWPVLGMWVPREPLWHESRFRKASGRASFVGWLVTLAALAATYLLPFDELAVGWRGSLLPVLFYQAIPIVPFEGMDGYRVLRWSRRAFAAGVALSVGLLVYVYTR